MDIREYPRPPGDTGLGIHWSAGPVAAVPLDEIRRRWLPELLAMNIKWVKCLHDGAEGLVEELRANDMMPIVRLYRYQPNPGRLDRELQERVKRLLAAGAVYFEVNNEPNLREEWRPGEWEAAGERLPEIVAEHWIADAEYVLEQGGLPAFPAPTPGGHWDDVDFMRRALGYVAERGRADLFQAGAWLAVHNYFFNHPPDYPYDPVNQYGEPLTAEEWERYNFREPLDVVNRRRRQGRAPGRTLREDSNGFLKYRAYRDLFVEIFGFEVPVLTTEGGAVMGRTQDLRYPPINTDLHARYNLFGFIHMADAPDYYFCNCPWLLANQLLGHGDLAWENDAWYSERWPGGHLPIVQEIKQRAPWPERKPARHRPGAVAVRIEGGAGHTVVVRRAPEGHFVADAQVDATGTARVGGLAPGRYRAEIVGARVESNDIDINDSEVLLTLTAPPRQSRVEGQVHGAEEPLEVRLLVQDDGEERLVRRARVRPGEPFTFDRLWAGRYRLVLTSDPPVESEPFELDGRNQHRVELVVPRRQWRYRVENPSGQQPTDQRRSVLVVVLPEGVGPTVRVDAPWAVLTARVGNKPEINPRAAVLDALPAGTYRVQVEGVPGSVTLFLDGQSTATVFLEPEEIVEEPALGRLRGLLEGQNVAGVEVVLRREGQEYARTQTDPGGGFIFEELPAGRYTLFVPSLNVESTPFELDGRSALAFRLPVGAPPVPSPEPTSASGGEAPGAPVLNTYLWLWFPPDFQGEPALLYDVVVPFAVEHGWSLGFSAAPARVARRAAVVALAGQPPALEAEAEVVIGRDPLELGARLQRLADRWAQVRVRPFGTVRGRLENAPETARVVQLWSDDVLVAERPLDEHGNFWFDRVPPGRYVVRLANVEGVNWPVEVEADETCQVGLVWPGTRRLEGMVARRASAPLSRYVLVGRTSRPLAQATVRLVLPWLAAAACVLGFRPQEAAGAQAVLILAYEQEVPPTVEAQLRETGAQVQRFVPATLADLEARLRLFLGLS